MRPTPGGSGVIRSKEDYLRFLDADRRALGIVRSRPRLFGDDIWKFERLLRAVEFSETCRQAWYHRPGRTLLFLRFHLASVRLGFTIPPHVFGPGLAIDDRGTIVVNSSARIGPRCRIGTCVNIGTTAGKDTEAPTIGADVRIGPGVMIFGPITIADAITIEPNAVVNRSFLQPGIRIAGAPAREVTSGEAGGLAGTLSASSHPGSPGTGHI